MKTDTHLLILIAEGKIVGFMLCVAIVAAHILAVANFAVNKLSATWRWKARTRSAAQ